MLFLLNNKVIEIAAPEAHLLQRWRQMGCGDPRLLRAHEAVAFATDRYGASRTAGDIETDLTDQDIAALIIAKTGANSLVLKPNASGGFEPRIRDIPPLVLETYLRGAANDPGHLKRA